GAVAARDVGRAQIIRPARLIAIAILVIGKRRVGVAAVIAVIEPRRVAELGVARAVVIAEGVAAGCRADEQRRQQRLRGDHERRLIEAVDREILRPKDDRREEHAAAAELVVPKAIDEDVAGGGPHITSRRPDPTLLIRNVVSRPPNIARVAIDPNTW